MIPGLTPLRPRPEFAEALKEGENLRREFFTRVGLPASSPAGSAVVSPAVDDKSVAVLAFANLSDDKNNEYFSDGISEELLNVLAKVPGLKVTARTSSFHFKGTNTAIPEIAQQLGVAYVVEGSVRKSGDKVRITAQLIKAADGFNVWSDKFDRDLRDIFAVQDEIAGLIAKNLALKFSDTSHADKTVHPEAYNLYLEARQYALTISVSDLARGEALFQRALSIDPGFTRAAAGLALLRAARARNRCVGTRYIERELEEIDRLIASTLRLDPNLSEAHAAAGTVLWTRNRVTEAEAEFHAANKLGFNSEQSSIGPAFLLMDQGRPDLAIEAMDKARAVNPLAWALWDIGGVAAPLLPPLRRGRRRLP